MIEKTPEAVAYNAELGPLPEAMRDYPEAGQPVYTKEAVIAFGRQERAAERERCAAWVDARRDAFCEEHGSIDPDTGALEFGRGAHADAKDEYVAELEEIAAGLRALKA